MADLALRVDDLAYWRGFAEDIERDLCSGDTIHPERVRDLALACLGWFSSQEDLEGRLVDMEEALAEEQSRAEGAERLLAKVRKVLTP